MHSSESVNIYFWTTANDRQQHTCCQRSTQPQGEESGNALLYSGWRRGLFQDQGHNPAEEADGRLLPAPERKSFSTKLGSNNVRFLFDGERLHENQTPKDLNMENGDEIDVVIEQVGGYDEWLSSTESAWYSLPIEQYKTLDHSSYKFWGDGGILGASSPSIYESSSSAFYYEGAGYDGLFPLELSFSTDSLLLGADWPLLAMS